LNGRAARFAVACVAFLAPTAALAKASLGPMSPPRDLVARDKPGDSGGSIVLTWTDPDSAGRFGGVVLEIRRSDPPSSAWTTLGEVPLGVGRYEDTSVPNGRFYRYQVRTRTTVGAAVVFGIPSESGPATAHDDWFRPQRLNSLITTLIFATILLVSIRRARSGKSVFIRRIAGLSMVDEAIGRATETGKKVLYIPGTASMDDIQSVAALAILGHVARATARYDTNLDVPNSDPLTFASARETVRSAYQAEGRPDLYREEMVNYVTYDQYAYTAAVAARMVRERPATNFLIGHFFAESLILAETGQSTGAIQIAGMADPTQLPFFIATCDYTLIGEELYAASAYLSREPVLLGSVQGQDLFKALCIAVGLIGIVLASFGHDEVARMLRIQ